MAGAHPVALRIKQNAGQHAGPVVIAAISPLDAVGAEDDLDLVPKALVDDSLVFAGVALVLVDGLAAIDPVLQHEIERTAGERLAPVSTPVRCLAGLADDPLLIQVGLEQPDRPQFAVTPEALPDRLGLFRIDDELAVLDVISAR